MTDDDAKCRHWFGCTLCQVLTTPDSEDLLMRIALLESRTELLEFELRQKETKE